jgi:hypothetical protein
MRAEQAGKSRFANPLAIFSPIPRISETVAKFPVTPEGTQNIWISASDSAEKEALSSCLPAAGKR